MTNQSDDQSVLEYSNEVHERNDQSSLSKSNIQAKQQVTTFQPNNEKNIISIPAFHVARGFAIFFMILQHVALTYGTETTLENGVGVVLFILGTVPAAPIFMMIMGFFFIKEENNQKLISIRKKGLRGFKLFFTGYLFNFIRFAIPIGLAYILSGDPQYSVDLAISYIFVIDIFQFAGIAYLFMTILEKVKLIHRNWLLIALCVCIGIISPLLWGITTGNIIIDEILRIFWGNDEYVFFPFFPWIIYSLIGVILRNSINSYDNKNKIFNHILKMGIILLVVGLISLLFNVPYLHGDYTLPGLGYLSIFIGIVFVWLKICHLIASLRIPRFLKFLKFWSINTTRIYWIQWILIAWGIILLGENLYSGIILITLVIVFLFLTHFIIIFSEKIKSLSSE